MERILIIEDDPLLQEELKHLLEGAGYAASSVEDFSRALEQVRASGADLILLDIGLPGQDGYRLCTAIRRFSQVPSCS